ncbi:hypothetical protein [Luteolibacter marinus]|uniref:hypothetical protein n=1 Tax=Luteolibacter marinus TaxID=2776705 RepID=UPI0018673D3F|nr:hypothetical protein [Luteolibacter marinus]
MSLPGVRGPQLVETIRELVPRSFFQRPLEITEGFPGGERQRYFFGEPVFNQSR